MSIMATTAHTKEAATSPYDAILCGPPGDRRTYRNKTEHFEKNNVQT